MFRFKSENNIEYKKSYFGLNHAMRYEKTANIQNSDTK